MIDVVGLNADLSGLTVADARKNLLTLLQGKHVADRGNNVVLGQGLSPGWDVKAQLLVDLVASHLAHVVTLGITVEVVEEGVSGLDRSGLTWANLLVDLFQGLFAGLDRVLSEGLKEQWVILIQHLNLRGGEADRLEEQGDGKLTLAVDTHRDCVAAVDFKLKPCAT